MNAEHDWFSEHAPTWSKVLGHFSEVKCAAVEIGSFEGVSAAWIASNLLKHPASSLVCIDTWDAVECIGRVTSVHEASFDANVAQFNNVRKVKAPSSEALRYLPTNSIDLAYVDGDHEAKSVIADAAAVWRLLCVGGIVVFDDYTRRVKYARVQPRVAIDFFMHAWATCIELVHVGEQVFAKKTRD